MNGLIISVLGMLVCGFFGPGDEDWKGVVTGAGVYVFGILVFYNLMILIVPLVK